MTAAWVFFAVTMIVSPLDGTTHVIEEPRRSPAFESWMDCERASGALVLSDQFTRRAAGSLERVLVSPCDLRLVPEP
jgi:hypothetical protein